MIHRSLGSTLAVLAAAVALPAFATPLTFFGQDNAAPYAVPAKTDPATKRAEWIAKLAAGSMSTETFQDNIGLKTPLSGLFGGTSSKLEGDGEVLDQVIAGGSKSGRFSTSSDCTPTDGSGCGWFETTQSFTLTFDKAISAFSFFGTDIGDFDGTLTLTLLRGGKEQTTLDVVTSAAASSADTTSLLFFGFIDTEGSYDGIRFNVSQKPGGEVDALGFDDFMRGDALPPVDVPEPGSLALAGLALAGLGAARRKRG